MAETAPLWPILRVACAAVLETSRESGRFRGICYRVANWVQIGRAQGRAS